MAVGLPLTESSPHLQTSPKSLHCTFCARTACPVRGRLLRVSLAAVAALVHWFTGATCKLGIVSDLLISLLTLLPAPQRVGASPLPTPARNSTYLSGKPSLSGESSGPYLQPVWLLEVSAPESFVSPLFSSSCTPATIDTASQASLHNLPHPAVPWC